MNLSKTESIAKTVAAAALAILAGVGIYSSISIRHFDYAPGDMNVRVDPMTCVEYARFQYGPEHQSYVLRVDRNGRPVLFGPCMEGKS